ncbi:MAG TPA: YidC/Oxa1 family membrane protein insertase [Miltoncostaeaceae bacterium]|nr:YidC/Oxa1 family membrane protein insertase [Miltoncostaeaceae bacterium]
MNPLSPLEDALRWVVDRLHENVGLTYGWSIVVLVLLVRAALLPLVIRQYRSLRQMQVVAPQLKEIQRQYKGDRKKQQEELMKFYQENSINPFSSCLPMLAQLPVFFALYYVLKNFAEDAQDGTDLGFMGVIPDITLNVTDLALWSSVVIGLVYGLSQLLSSELSFEPHTPETQRRIMRILPVVVVIGAFQFPFPAGLAIYWVTSNLWTAGQQLVIRHKIGLHIAEHPEEASRTRSSRTPPKGAGRARGDEAEAVIAEEAADGAEPLDEGTDMAESADEAAPASVGGRGDLARPREPRPPRAPKGPNGGSRQRRRPPQKGGGGAAGRAGQRRAPKKRR